MSITTSHINIAFDGKTPEELIDFIGKHIVTLGDKEQSRVHIKINDLLAEIGVEGLKILQKDIKDQIGIDIRWMIDGKWYDIPNTVANYVKRLEGLNVVYYTVHASGGSEMIRAAKLADPDKKILAITILTSMSERETRVLYDENRANSILRLAKVALEAGADGLVCSPADTSMLREVFGEKYGNFLLVTPNIQRTGKERHDDQNKSLTNTPSGAIENGSTDIVVGRPILQAENPGEVISEILHEMKQVEYMKSTRGEYQFEKVLHTGDWESLLKYIGAIYIKPPTGKYVRYTSGLISDAYTNNGASERSYQVLNRASDELRDQMEQAGIQPDLIIGAQMGSVRLSLSLAESMSLRESLYTEKDGDLMELKRHDLGSEGLKGRKVVLSEDVITKGSTIAKMTEMVKKGGGEVVAVTCLANRSGKDSFEGIPLFHCYVPQAFSLFWDEKTLEKTRGNELAAGKSPEQAEEAIEKIRSTYPKLPADARIAEKPKNEWNELIKSMG